MSVRLDRRNEVWDVWQALAKAFGFSRFAWHLSASKSAMGFYGVDVISTLSRTSMALAAQEILQPLDDRTLTVLHGLARLNADRNSAMWRMAALFYVTGPTSLTLLAFQIAPDFSRSVIEQGSLYLALIFVLITLWMVFYYSIQWRAAQVLAVVELEQTLRGLDLTKP